MKGKKKYILIIAAFAILLWMLTEVATETGINDMKSGFKELAFLRNEQNTGPVIRLYAVGISDTLWNELEAYGNYMPHTKYGTTRVYFFMKDTPAPDKLFLEDGNFPDKYKPYCVAVYEKNGMSQSRITKYPFTHPQREIARPVY